MDAWPFPEPPDLGVFVTRPVLDGTEPLLGVDRDDEGDWSFWGTTEINDDNVMDLVVLVHLGHLVDAHPELTLVADLDFDQSATRSGPNEPFVRRPGVGAALRAEDDS